MSPAKVPYIHRIYLWFWLTLRVYTLSLVMSPAKVPYIHRIYLWFWLTLRVYTWSLVMSPAKVPYIHRIYLWFWLTLRVYALSLVMSLPKYRIYTEYIYGSGEPYTTCHRTLIRLVHSWCKLCPLPGIHFSVTRPLQHVRRASSIDLCFCVSVVFMHLLAKFAKGIMRSAAHFSHASWSVRQAGRPPPQKNINTLHCDWSAFFIEALISCPKAVLLRLHFAGLRSNPCRLQPPPKNGQSLSIELARTVYTHRVWPYVWWSPCQIYRIYTVYTYKCMVLASLNYLLSHIIYVLSALCL